MTCTTVKGSSSAAERQLILEMDSDERAEIRGSNHEGSEVETKSEGSGQLEPPCLAVVNSDSEVCASKPIQPFATSDMATSDHVMQQVETENEAPRRSDSRGSIENNELPVGACCNLDPFDQPMSTSKHSSNGIRTQSEDPSAPQCQLRENLTPAETNITLPSEPPPDPFCKLPRDPESHLSGRSAIINKMEAAFNDGNRLILLHGRPEVGKTEITLQLASRMRTQCSCILHINCAEPDVMEARVQSFCQELGLADSEQTNFPVRVGILSKHLRKHSSFLVILANCQDEAQKMLATADSPLRRLIEHENGKTIVTTSLSKDVCEAELCSLKFTPIEVPPFDKEECKDLITKYLKHMPCTDDHLQKLYDLSDGSPGVLRRMLKRILRTRQTLTEFLSTNPDTPASLDAIDRTDFKKIQEQPLLSGLFHLICLFSSHTPFNLQVLKLGLPEAMKNDLGGSCSHTKELARLAGRLKDCSVTQACSSLKEILELPLTHQLLEVTGDELELVRVPRVTQQKYFPFVSRKCGVCDSTIPKIACLCLTEASKRDWEHSQNLVPHLKAVLDRNGDKNHSIFTHSSPIALETRAILARHYVEDGKFMSAAKLLSTSKQDGVLGRIRHYLATVRKQQAPLASLAWLGIAYFQLGNCEEGIKILKTALKSPECSDPLVKGVVLTHLGSALTEAGQPEKAHRTFLEANKNLQQAKPALKDNQENRTKYNYCELGLFSGQKPEAYLLSRLGKLGRWKMYHLLSKMGPEPTEEDKDELKNVIEESVKNFESARDKYSDNRRLQLIMSLYAEVQNVHQDPTNDPECRSRCEEIVKELQNILPLGHHHHCGWAKEKMAWIRLETAPGSEEELRKALSEMNAGLTIKEITYDETHRKVADSYRLKAMILEKLDQRDEAIKCLKKAEDILVKGGEKACNNPKLKLIRDNLEELGHTDHHRFSDGH